MLTEYNASCQLSTVVETSNKSGLKVPSRRSIMLAMKIGERIKQARAYAKLTQRQLAALIGSTQQAIQRLERGHVHSTRFTLEIARACRVNPNWLDTGKGDMVPTRVDLRGEIIEPDTAEMLELYERMDEHGKEIIKEISSFYVQYWESAQREAGEVTRPQEDKEEGGDPAQQSTTNRDRPLVSEPATRRRKASGNKSSIGKPGNDPKRRTK